MDIKLNAVSRSFQGRTILNSISIDINSGAYISVVGESGAGKTTLMSLVNTILKPSSGHIFFNGRPLQKMSPYALSVLRRDKISMILQDPVVFRNLNVRDNILLPYHFSRGGTDRRVREMYTSLITSFRLKDKEKLLPYQLSGGEVQKIAILRAVLKPMEVLVADEPTGDLDADTAERITLLFHDLNKSGVTIVMTTHNEKLSRCARERYLLTNCRLAAK